VSIIFVRFLPRLESLQCQVSLKSVRLFSTSFVQAAGQTNLSRDYSSGSVELRCHHKLLVRLMVVYTYDLAYFCCSQKFIRPTYNLYRTQLQLVPSGRVNLTTGNRFPNVAETVIFWILNPHSSDYEEYNLVGCDAVWSCIISAMFPAIMVPSSCYLFYYRLISWHIL
jgi:hypothetical protein